MRLTPKQAKLLLGKSSVAAAQAVGEKATDPKGWDDSRPGLSIHHLAKPVACRNRKCGKLVSELHQVCDGTKIYDAVCPDCAAKQEEALA